MMTNSKGVDSVTGRNRQSGFELLRIIAMVMIFAFHFVLYNATPIWELPFSAARLWITVAFYDLGKVGVLVFFAITAWFLCDSSGGT